jgi:hypothetical protein
MKCYNCSDDKNLGCYRAPTDVFYFCREGEEVLGSEMTVCKFKLWEKLTRLNYAFEEKKE